MLVVYNRFADFCPTWSAFYTESNLSINQSESADVNAMFLICFKNESLAREQIKNRFG